MNADAMERAGMTLDEDTRILNVREPWAHALIHGDKDLENRPNHLNLALPAWVLILSSKSKPTKKELEKLRSFGNEPPSGFASQEIIGAIKVVDSVTSHSSKWFSGPVAWVVGEKFAFPVKNEDGSRRTRHTRLHRKLLRLIPWLAPQIVHARFQSFFPRIEMHRR